MKKLYDRFINILAAIVLGAVGLFVVTVLLVLFGNPISRILTEVRANSYLHTKYPELELKVDSVSYDFKHPSYQVDVVSPSSEDTHFTLICDYFGGVQEDYYADTVESNYNTLVRIQEEYADLVSCVLDYPSTELSICKSYAEFHLSCVPGSPEKDYCLDWHTLSLDGEYDIYELGEAYGRVIVFTEEPLTSEEAANLLLDLRAYLDEKGIPFYAVHLNVYPSQSTALTKGVRLCDFLRSDIYSEDLEARIEIANAETEAYLSKLDYEFDWR